MTFICERCHNEVDEHYRVHDVVDGNPTMICDGCFLSTHRYTPARCTHCSEMFHRGLLAPVLIYEHSEWTAAFLCARCIDGHYEHCDGCHNYMPSGQSVEHGGFSYCRKCYTSILNGARPIKCIQCGEHFLPQTDVEVALGKCPACLDMSDDDHYDDDDDDDGGERDDETIAFKKDDETDMLVNDARSEI